MSIEAVAPTSVIYLLGSPGVGKRTIAHALHRRSGAVVLDNQIINFPVMAAFDWDGRRQLPSEIWQYTSMIREAVLATLEQLAPLDRSYVLTNSLEQDAKSRALFARVGDIAAARGATFVPVFLTCDRDEQLRRVVAADRVANRKLSGTALATSFIEGTAFLRPEIDSLLDVDTTRISPDESADAILIHASSLQERGQRR